MSSEAIATRAGNHERRAPAHQRSDRPAKFAPPGRERIGDTIAVAVELALDHACFFHLTETLGEQVGGDPGQAGLKLPVTGRAPEQLAHDEQAPPVAHDVERPCQAAVLAIGPRGHRSISITSKSSASKVGRASTRPPSPRGNTRDRKSTRLNSSHVRISYAVFCLKKKKKSPSHRLFLQKKKNKNKNKKP